MHNDNQSASGHLLDQPVEMAFRTHWRAVARRNGSAWMLPADVGPFAALGGASPEDEADFSQMVQGRKTPVIILQKEEISVPAGLELLARLDGVQMVYEGQSSEPDRTELEYLSTDDAAEMFDLARLTQPGPFEERTHILGTFLGIRKQGRLIAMAGQRMQLPGWTEISAVCAHPDEQRAGLGSRLIKAMCSLIEEDGNRPFLHTYASNTGAIALYERLGFRLRGKVQVASLAHH